MLSKKVTIGWLLRLLQSISKMIEGKIFMKLTYDPTYNIAYIHFKEKQTEIDSIHISDELIIDIAPDGTIYGIELLNANEQLQIGDTGKLLMINESTGERAELTLVSDKAS
jgi:uncharacterized protein YuzE